MKIYVDDGAAIAFGILKMMCLAFELIAQARAVVTIISWLFQN